jgi:hypothetical protein
MYAFEVRRAKAPDPASVAALNPSYRLRSGQFDRKGDFDMAEFLVVL